MFLKLTLNLLKKCSSTSFVSNCWWRNCFWRGQKFARLTLSLDIIGNGTELEGEQVMQKHLNLVSIFKWQVHGYGPVKGLYVSHLLKVFKGEEVCSLCFLSSNLSYYASKYEPKELHHKVTHVCDGYIQEKKRKNWKLKIKFGLSSLK